MRELKIFALGKSKDFGEQVCAYLTAKSREGEVQHRLAKVDERLFQDEEVYCASLENVRGADVFVIASPYTDDEESVNDKLMKLFVMIGSLRDASAERITAVMPYYPYCRQDRKTSSRSPITVKYLAGMFHAVSADRILTIDPHNPGAVQTDLPVEWRMNADILEANGLFAAYLSQEFKAGSFGKDWSNLPMVAMSPDAGGTPRTRKARAVLERYLKMPVETAHMDKIHTHEAGKDAEIRGNGVSSTVPLEGRWVVIFDDMISSGKTILECTEAAKARRAKGVIVCATHGLFVGKANEFLDHDFIHRIVITDTVKPFRLKNKRIRDKVTVLATAELFGEAIRRTHRSESISDLIEKNGTNVVCAQA